LPFPLCPFPLYALIPVAWGQACTSGMTALTQELETLNSRLTSLMADPFLPHVRHPLDPAGGSTAAGTATAAAAEAAVA
jgi:hypothetical protein